MNESRKKRKTGRNDPCPCGSGKKFKRCHGNPLIQKGEQRTTEEALQRKINEVIAIQKQREQQQGLGRPIVSTFFNGWRIVAVGGATMQSRSWRTFHDFLFDYAKYTFGEEWGTNELGKSREERHPILNWYYDATMYLNSFVKEAGKFNPAPSVGYADAFLGLAYSLYLLEHNARVQKVLLNRLKNRDQFFGACYETYVASALIKAGFEIEFEDESDSTTSHCEFTATFKKTGKKFSVEAKMRGPNKTSVGVGKQLIKALRKHALQTRVVFIEINITEENKEAAPTQNILEGILESLRKWEPILQINNKPAPSAYIIVTNNPHVFSQQAVVRRWAMAEGFKIPDFKLGTRFSSLRDALQSRERHIEMFSLMKSLAQHSNIPATFDGEIPEFVFQNSEPRLRIGNKYQIPDGTGKEAIGELQHAAVMEKDKMMHGVYKLNDGKNVIASCPLTEAELAAYHRHPDTFFGIDKPHTKGIQDPLDFYDFLMNCYSNTPKEILLGFLKGALNFESLKELPQKKLASIYCEGLASYVFHQSKMGKSSKPGTNPLKA